MKTEHIRRRTGWLLVPTLLAGAVVLAGCSRDNSETTAGQKVDNATASVERKADELKADASKAATQAGTTAGNAADAVADKAKDMAITTAVNGKLVADPALSAMRINVDTVNGRVALRGTAPDDAARERATTLARAVDGVVSVDNELTVQPRS